MHVFRLLFYNSLNDISKALFAVIALFFEQHCMSSLNYSISTALPLIFFTFLLDIKEGIQKGIWYPSSHKSICLKQGVYRFVIFFTINTFDATGLL